MRAKTILLAATLLAATPLLKAQDTAAAPQRLSLTLRQAQDYAIAHNYAFKNASLDQRKAYAERWQAISSMLPQGTAGFAYQNMLGYEMKLPMSPVAIPMNPTGQLTAYVAVALSGAQIVGVMLANISVRLGDIMYRQTIQTTEADVKSLYTNLLVMQQTMSLLDSSLANMLRLKQNTDDAVAVGASEQVDADKLSVQVSMLRNTISSNKRALELLKNSLLLRLGANPDDEITLTSTLDDILDVNDAAQMLRKPFDIGKNFDYQALVQSEAASKKQLALAYMDYLPTASIFYQYSHLTYFGKKEGFNMNPPNMLGINLSWSIFSSGMRWKKVAAAKYDHEKATNNRLQAEDALRVQHKQASFDLVNALDAYRIQKENIDVSRRVFDNVAEKYKYGRASSLEVTQASTDVINAQSSYIQAVVGVVNAQVALEKVLSENQYTEQPQ